MWLESSFVLSESRLALPERLLIISITFNRAVLILDLPQSWVSFDLSDLRILADRLVPANQRDDPRRFIPGSVHRTEGERWSRYSSRSRRTGWSWLDHASANGPMSAQSFCSMVDFVFLAGSGSISQGSVVDSVRGSSFNDSCIVSSLAPLATSLVYAHGSFSVDPSVDPPRKRIRAFESSLSQSSFSRPPNVAQLRFPEHLCRSHCIRIQLLSVQGSWKSLKSGLLSWGHFMDSVFPQDDHFDVQVRHIRSYVSMFRNAGSFGQYLSHIRLAVRILDGRWGIPSDVLSSVNRGLRKITVRSPAGTLTRSQMKSLVKSLIVRARIDLARFVVIAYHYMTRVQSELYPLQVNGRSVNPDHWHSHVINDRTHVSLVFHHRKNSRSGATIKRTCLCSSSVDLLCGVCSFRGILRDFTGSPGSRIFSSINLVSDMQLIRQIVHEFGIHNLSWHSFRRSCAQELLRSGSTISQIVRAGGWRSAAFVQYLHRRDLDDRDCLNLVCQDSDGEDHSFA
jgi:hypothetical protein